MHISKAIRQRILNDNDFSLRLSLVFKIKQFSLHQLVNRNSRLLTLYDAVAFYQAEGYTDTELFEPEEKEQPVNA